MLLTTGYEVAWMDGGDANHNDLALRVSITKLWRNRKNLTVSELEREVGDTEQIALMCRGGLPAGLSDKLLNSVRWLLLVSEISEHDWTE